MTNSLLGNRYQVIRPLSSGGFGDTYLAEDQHSPTKQRCVVKKLRPINEEPQTYQLVKERFDREAVILEDLGKHHPQIPSLYAYFEEDHLFYLVEEWVEGLTILELVAQQGTQSESSVKELLSSLLPVLNYVHNKRIVHRDIKPDNIILRAGDRQPVLIDFGAVKETMGTMMTASGNSARSIVVGTPGFMPSEQSIGRPVYASDLYSLGLTAIFMLTGKLPQELPNDPGTGELNWRQYAPMVSPTLGNALSKAIQVNYRDRYQNTSEMLAALQSSSGIPTTVVSPPPPPSATVVNPYPATAVSPPVVPPSTPATSGGAFAEWQKALMTGSIVGLFAVAAIFVTQARDLFGTNDKETAAVTTEEPAPQNGNGTSNPSGSNQNSSQPPNNSTETVTNPAPPLNPETPPNPQPDAQQNSQPVSPPQSNYSPPAQPTISRDEALQLVNTWQNYKRRLFAPPYDRSLGSDLLTGIAYSKNIRRSDGEQSSVDWLIDNNAYYAYGVQKVDSLQQVIGDSNFANVIVVITEQRTLYVDGKPSQDENSGLEVLRVNYSLQKDQGRWKIADYDTETLSHQ